MLLLMCFFSLTEAVDSSEQFIAKPGTCPTIGKLYPGLENCEWDLDCPGWQKCCQRSHQSVCSHASSARFTQNRGYRFNVTMTMRMDFTQLMSNDKSLVNHTKLLQTMVTGALHFDVSVYYLNSWPVYPYGTATSVLIDSNSPLSMYNVTAKLHLLLKCVQVSFLRVEDVDECQESVLHQCSSQARCNNTVGSYHCTCHQGYTDVDPSNPGTNCADFNGCATGENDCSPWATCSNTFASYTCACLEGFVDNNPERPGRVCRRRDLTFETIHTLESTRDTFGTTSSRPASPSQGITLPRKMVTEAEASSTPLVTFVPFVTPADQFNAQATTPSSSVTITQSTPQTLSSSHITLLTSITPTALETTTKALKTVAILSASSTATPAITPNTPTPAISASQITSTVLKTTTNTTTSDTDVSPSSIPAVTVRTIDSPPATAIATDTKSSHVTTTADSTTTTTAVGSSNTDLVTAGAVPINTISVFTTNTTALRAATKASVLGGISVQCRVAAITVTISQNFLVETKIQESALYLGFRECGVDGGNATHVQLTVAWNECSTRLVHNETHYTASVTLFSTMDQYISPGGTAETPRIRLELPISCGYMKNMVISADFSSMGYDIIKEVITGSGSFPMTLQLMNGTAPLPHNSTLSPKEAVVMDVSLNTSSEQIKVVVGKCWATPTHNPEDTYSHTFLESSCPTNVYAKALMNGNSSTSRVSVQIFSIVNMNVIYLHCQVHICVQIGEDSCVPDCLQRTRRASRNIVRSAFLSSGPLLKSDEESFDEKYTDLQIAGLSCLGISVTLCFLVSFICLLYCQRNRIGHYNFTITPKQDNRTFLVFNA
ncbi:uromodulin-like 1 [Nelusetta ayraudi]|uniref:uromodulin-like 1 n=1 Tax=Nelusetta ayraudi TaxID=303726 RepID=UPI003F6F65D4